MTEQEIQALDIEHLITRDFAVDPKYRPIQMRLLHIEKGYLIPVDEPLYILRGNDPFAPIMAQWYYDALVDEVQSKIVVGHQETSSERVATFLRYHQENPEMVGRIYPEPGCECILETPPCSDFGEENDPMQDPEYTFWDFKIYHRYLNFYVPATEPLMIFRGKDALLVRIIDKHNEYIRNNIERYGEKTAEMLIHFNDQRRVQVKEFHRDNPERVGVTCSVFQKPTGKEYQEAMAELDDGREETVQKMIDDAEDA